MNQIEMKYTAVIKIKGPQPDVYWFSQHMKGENKGPYWHNSTHWKHTFELKEDFVKFTLVWG